MAPITVQPNAEVIHLSDDSVVRYIVSSSLTSWDLGPGLYLHGNVFKGPVKAVSGHKIAPNRFKTTYRSVLTFEEKKQSDRNSLLLTCLKLFQASTRL